MSKIEVNTIDVASGCTMTIGSSGKTITIAAGATITNNGTQSGFGRSGSVNWDTTAKTTGFTAVSGNGYFVNTGSGAVTVTLPASPSAGDIVAIADYGGTAATSNITIDRNGSNFEGGATNGAILNNRDVVTLVYVDGTQGWLSVADNTGTYQSREYVAATGGNTTATCGNYKIHTFTAPGTLCVSNIGNSAGNNQFEYLVVAGGGGGGLEDGSSTAAGGAGGGGMRFAAPSLSGCSYPGKPLAGATITATPGGIPITVGAGGAAPSCSPVLNNGSDSVFSSITSAGGGGGGNTNHPASATPGRRGNSGGSGGGGGHANPGSPGNVPPVTPAQGTDGGDAAVVYLSGGGGGAVVAGTDSTSSQGGPGGDGAGFPNAFGSSNGVSCGSHRYYAGGGGGGGSSNRPQTGPAGNGGKGGGAPGGAGQTNAPASSVTNSGGGGGGAGNKYPGTGKIYGSNGGSGIVVIRYQYQGS